MRLLVTLGFAVLAFAWPSFIRADTTPAPSQKPLLFYSERTANLLFPGEMDTPDPTLSARAKKQLLAKLPSVFGSRIIELTSAPASPAELWKLCQANDAKGVLKFDDRYAAEQPTPRLLQLMVSVESCGGTYWFLGGGPDRATVENQRGGQLLDAGVTQALSYLHDVLAKHQAAAENFANYGLYMDNSKPQSFWEVEFDQDATTVTHCDPVGTAYRAGLRFGDTVTAIDGIPTSEAKSGKFDDLLDVPERHIGPWKITIRESDLSSRTIQFENEPLSWYIAHPL